MKIEITKNLSLLINNKKDVCSLGTGMSIEYVDYKNNTHGLITTWLNFQELKNLKQALEELMGATETNE